MRAMASRFLGPCVLSGLMLGGCTGQSGGWSMDSAVLGTAEAAPAAAPAAAPSKTLWRERGPNDPLPQGFTPMPSLAPLVKQLKPGVVNVYTSSVVRQRPGMNDPFEEFFRFHEPEGGRRQSLGSGFIVSPDGYVVTNNHVVERANVIEVKLADGREFEAVAVGRDPKTDLALLKIKADGPLKDLPFVFLGDSDPLEVGDYVIAVGNPFGLDHSVSQGIVSAKERVIGAGPYDDFIQTDAAINPGNSGGPLFNARGEVIGVNTAIVARGQGIGFAVPVNMVKQVLQPLMEKGRVVRGWLGVSIQDLTPEIARSLSLDQTHGALIAGVQPQGPAEQGGLRPGDVVVGVNGRKVDSYYQLSRFVAAVPPGSRAQLAVLRDGKPATVDVKVGVRPEDEAEVASAVDTSAPRDAAQKLGLQVGPLPVGMMRQLGVQGGVRIVSVRQGSPAERAGARQGDVLVEMQRRPVRGVQDFNAILGAVRPGQTVLLRVQRQNASVYIAAQLPR